MSIQRFYENIESAPNHISQNLKTQKHNSSEDCFSMERKRNSHVSTLNGLIVENLQILTKKIDNLKNKNPREIRFNQSNESPVCRQKKKFQGNFESKNSPIFTKQDSNFLKMMDSLNDGSQAKQKKLGQNNHLSSQKEMFQNKMETLKNEKNNSSKQQKPRLKIHLETEKNIEYLDERLNSLRLIKKKLLIKEKKLEVEPKHTQGLLMKNEQANFVFKKQKNDFQKKSVLQFPVFKQIKQEANASSKKGTIANRLFSKRNFENKPRHNVRLKKSSEIKQKKEPQDFVRISQSSSFEKNNLKGIAKNTNQLILCKKANPIFSSMDRKINTKKKTKIGNKDFQIDIEKPIGKSLDFYTHGNNDLFENTNNPTRESAKFSLKKDIKDSKSSNGDGNINLNYGKKTKDSEKRQLVLNLKTATEKKQINLFPFRPEDDHQNQLFIEFLKRSKKAKSNSLKNNNRKPAIFRSRQNLEDNSGFLKKDSNAEHVKPQRVLKTQIYDIESSTKNSPSLLKSPPASTVDREIKQHNELSINGISRIKKDKLSYLFDSNELSKEKLAKLKSQDFFSIFTKKQNLELSKLNDSQSKANEIKSRDQKQFLNFSKIIYSREMRTISPKIKLIKNSPEKYVSTFSPRLSPALTTGQKLGNGLTFSTIVGRIKSFFNELLSSSGSKDEFLFSSSIEYYKIESQIGKGCFGDVYRATQILTSLPVALKVISKQMIFLYQIQEKIIQEITILKLVHSDFHLAQLLEVFEDEENIYIVLDYLPNGDLITYFKEKPLFNEEKLKVFFSKIVFGVQNLHNHGIVHRDIKMDNILLDESFSPVLSDFGISSFFDSKRPIKDTGGTPAYLPPEVIRAKGEICFKSDVWSLGVLLYALSFGTVPFEANNVQELYRTILIGKFRIPESSTISSELKSLISKMITVNLSRRYSIEDILKDLWLEDTIAKLNYEKKEMFSTLKKKEKNRKDLVIRQLNDFGFEIDFICNSINRKEFNHVTSCYFNLMRHGVHLPRFKFSK